jgi:hypothetical protein
MKHMKYTFSVIRYVHDPVAGEQLNVGVVLCSVGGPYLGHLLEYHYERLSSTFVDFDGEHYKRVIRQLETAFTTLARRPAGSLFQLQEPVADVQQVISMIMPDRDTSIQFGPMLAGITDDLERELRRIFNRMVTSQYEMHKGEKRTDEEVWRVYQSSLMRRHVFSQLKQKTFTTEDYSLKFDHAFKNEKWHVLEPVSLDYVRPEGLQDRATRILGQATALSDNPEMGKLYLLLGPPKKKEHNAAYKKAKHLLEKIPIDHELVEESQADKLARDIAAYMREHGVTED